jgi:hypothetical protein
VGFVQADDGERLFLHYKGILGSGTKTANPGDHVSFFLYDWVNFFAESFEAMVDVLTSHLDVPKDQLLDEFKSIHQEYGNSEQPFAVLELPSVRRRYADLTRAEIARELDDVLHAFNSARRKHL